MTKSGNNYDVVLGCNLIDRLPDPSQWIELAKQKVSKDGIIINCSPYTWLEEFTPINKWIGGYRNSSAENITTQDGLREIFKPEFSEIDSDKLPFVIPFSSGDV